MGDLKIGPIFYWGCLHTYKTNFTFFNLARTYFFWKNLHKDYIPSNSQIIFWKNLQKDNFPSNSQIIFWKNLQKDNFPSNSHNIE